MLSDHPSPCMRQQQQRRLRTRNPGRQSRLGVDHGIPASADALLQARRARHAAPDDSSLAIHVDYAACILCDRCIRGCSEIRHNNVIARQGKGYFAAIAFDANEPMGNSSCVSCGECMVSCPTGALTNKKRPRPEPASQLRASRSAQAFSVETEDLLALPIFKDVSGTFLELNARRRRQAHAIKAGEIIVREGENGSTAFYILEGNVDVLSRSPRAHVTNPRTGAGLLQHDRAASSCPKKDREARRRVAPIPPTSPSTPPSICPTTTPSPHSAPATSSAR